MRIFKALLIACILVLVQPFNSFGVLRTFTGSANTNWNNPLNWVGGVIPTISDSVQINGNCAINTSSDSCYSLTITSGYSLTINGPFYLKVLGNMYGQGDLVLNSGGRFLLGGNNNHNGKLIAGPTTSVEYFGGNQNVQGGPNYKYYDLIISGSGNKTLVANDTINNSLDIKSGSFVLGGPLVNLLLINGPTTIASGASFIFGNAGVRVVTMMNNLSAAPGSTLDMAAPGLAHVLRLAGPSNSVGNFNTTNGSGSRVSYINNGGPQTIFSSNNYQQLEIKTAGPGNANLAGNIVVNDGLFIRPGATLNGTLNNFSISILKNDFLCDGIFNPGNCKVQFNGGGISQIIGATNPINFFQLAFNNNTTVNAAQVIAVGDSNSIGANCKLDLGPIVGHNVGNVSGFGTLALSAPNGGNTSFPSGTFFGFMSSGIIEYNSSNSYTIDQTNFSGSNYGVLNITGGGVKTLNNSVPNIMNLIVQGSTQFDLTNNGTPINISNFSSLGTVNFYGTQSISVFGFNNNFNFNNYSSSLFIPNDLNNASISTFTNDGYIQLNGNIINSGIFQSTPGSGSILELTGSAHGFSGNPIQVENLKLNMGGLALSLATNLKVNAALNFADDGKVILNSNDLVLGPSATIINTGTGSFGPMRMIESNGLVGPGALVKEGNSGTDFQSSYPIGNSGVYTPLTITNSTVSTSGVGTIRMKSIAHPTSPYGYANNYIQLASQNINSVSDFQFQFQFGNVGDYHTPAPNKVYRYVGNVPNNVVSPYSSIPGVTYGVSGTGNTNIDGDWRFELLSQPPLVTSFSPNPVCVGDTLNIKGVGFLNTDSVYVNNKKATFIIKSDTLLKASVSPSTSGKLKIFNAFGADSSKSVTVNVTMVDAGPAQTVCQGVAVNLNGTITGATKARWIGGTGTFVPNDSTLIATYQPNVSESTITLTLVPIDGCLPHPSSNLTINVQPKPGAAITPSGPTSFCSGGSVTLSGSPTGGFFYQWYNSGAVISTATSSTFTAIASGDYTLKVTDSISTCSDTSLAIVVTVNTNPIVTISPSSIPICQGQSVTLASTVSGGLAPYIYNWTPTSNLSSSTISNPVASPATSTTYSLMVTDANGCTNSPPAQVSITVNPLPSVTGTAQNSEICVGQSTVVKAFGSGGTAPYIYTWSPSASMASPNNDTSVVSPAATTNYSVMVQDAVGCSSPTPFVIPVAVNQLPTVTTTSSSVSLCSGNSKILNASGASGTPPYNYSWTPSLGLSSATVQNPTASPTSTTAYSVSISDSKGCVSVGSATISVNVNPAATATMSVSGSSSICSSMGGILSIDFTGVGPWDFSYNDGVTVYNQTKIYSSTYTIPVYPLSNTNYQLTSVTDSVCGTGTTSGSANFNVSTSPTSNAGSDVTVCAGVTIPLAGQVSTSLFNWTTNGSGTFTNSNSLSCEYIPSPADTLADSVYIFLSSDTAEPCPAATDTMVVKFIFLPSGNGMVGEGSTLCGTNDGSLLVTNAEAGVNYKAILGSLTLDVQPVVNGTVTFTIPNINLNPGWDTIHVQAVNTCGSVDISHSVVFKKGLSGTVNIVNNNNSVLCSTAGSPVQLTAPLASRYQWYWNNSYLVGDTIGTLFPVFPGDYSVVVFDSLNCPGIQSNKITISSQLPTPTISIQATGANYIDLATSSNNNLQWYGNGKAIFGANSTTLRVYYNGDYFVSYAQNGCRQVAAPMVISNPNFDLLAKKNFLANDSIIFIEPPLEENEELAVYPNPAKDYFKLNYIGASNDFIIVDIVGPLGEQVYHEAIEIKPGMNELAFEGLNLNTGLYRVILLDGTKKLLKSIQVCK